MRWALVLMLLKWSKIKSRASCFLRFRTCTRKINRLANSTPKRNIGTCWNCGATITSSTHASETFNDINSNRRMRKATSKSKFKCATSSSTKRSQMQRRANKNVTSSLTMKLICWQVRNSCDYLSVNGRPVMIQRLNSRNETRNAHRSSFKKSLKAQSMRFNLLSFWNLTKSCKSFRRRTRFSMTYLKTSWIQELAVSAMISF